ncbi:39S ribosomal protein L28 mitochondrial, partial [Taenia solium]
TPENEINSRLGMHIKREILLKLSDPEFKKLKPDIVAKYAQFIIPGNEAEWVGLTLDEAIKKQMKIDYSHERAAASIPKKEILTRALLKQLDSDKEHPQLCMFLSCSSPIHICMASLKVSIYKSPGYVLRGGCKFRLPSQLEGKSPVKICWSFTLTKLYGSLTKQVESNISLYFYPV